MSRLVRTLISIVIWMPLVSFLVNAKVDAQVSNVTNTTSTPIQGAGHDYIQMLSETVNPSNGSVSIRIQLPTPKSRGITLPFSISYDSNGARHLEGAGYPSFGSAVWKGDPGYLARNGWSYSVPLLNYDSWSESTPVLTGYSNGPVYTYYDCYYSAGFIFRDASGGRHDTNASTQYVFDPTAAQYCHGSPTNSGGDSQVLATFTGSRGNGTYNPLPFIVSDHDGTVYYFDSTVSLAGYTAPTQYILPTYIKDRNGNKVIVANSGSTYTMTDSAGRTAISAQAFGAAGTTTTVTAAGTTYQVVWKNVSSGSFTVPSQWVGPAGGPGSGFWCNGIPAVTAVNQTVISQIILPNGQSYRFYYGSDNPNTSYQNPYGMISEIDYPNGGIVRYTWKLSDTMNEFADFPSGYNAAGGGIGAGTDGCLYEYKTPVVASRQVISKTAADQAQTFTYGTNWNTTGTSWNSKTTNVTTTDNVIGKSALTNYTYAWVAGNVSPFSYTSYAPQIPVESSVSHYDWGNTSTPFKVVTKGWYNQFLEKCELQMVENNSSLVSGNFYSYVNGEVSDKKEFDFGQITSPATVCQTNSTTPTLPNPARETVTSYQSFASPPMTGEFIANKPSSTIVCSSGSSCTSTSSNRIAETDYVYDVGATASITAVQHDDSLFPAGSGIKRGNLTTQTRKCFVGGTACTDSTTSYTYDQTGQVKTALDANSNTTSYSYADSYSVGTPPGTTNTYLTQVTYPATNGVTHIESFQYRYSDGQLSSSTDQNGQVTSYQYNDSFLRPTQVNYPDGGQTSISYNDAPYNASNNTPNVTTTKKITSTLNLVTTSARDGMGRVVRTLLISDPDGTDITDTTYDGMGHVRTQSNPHRSSALSTDGVTTYDYDAFGRTLAVTKPDSSVAYTSYSGNTVTATDEAGHLRRSVTDSLGRLVEVDEPGVGTIPGTPSTGSITVTGGPDQSGTFNMCPNTYPYNCPQTIPDGGSIQITINGFTAQGGFGTGSTTQSIASSLTSALNVSGSPVTASVNGSVISLTSKQTGTASNYPISKVVNWNSQFFSNPSFNASTSGLSGGANSSLGANPLVTQYVYDGLNNLTCAVQKGTDTTAFTTCATASASWRPRSFTYNSLSQLVTATNPESGTISYTFDGNGNLHSRTAPKPNQTGSATVLTTYTYDALNRLTGKSYNDGVTPAPSYYYDQTAPWGGNLSNPIGRLTTEYSSTTAPYAASLFNYDSMGRPIQNAHCTPANCGVSGYDVYYAYDLSGNPTIVHDDVNYANQQSIFYQYDGAARPTQVTSNYSDAQHPGTLFTVDSTLGYFPNGAFRKGTYGNGLVQTNVYNNRLQPCLLDVVNSSSVTLQTCNDSTPGGNVLDFWMGYGTTNNNGSIVNWNATGVQSFVRTYSYDAMNRVSTMNDAVTAQPCRGLTWAYDVWGNRPQQNVTAGSCPSPQLSFDSKNRLTGAPYTYDAAGNLLTDGNHSYTYDAENRIIKVDGGSTASYFYDAEGRRVQKTATGKTTDYIYDLAGRVIEENQTSPSIAVQVSYVYLGGKLLAQYRDGTTYFVHQDHLGSTRLLTKVDKSIYDSLDYLPFGEQIAGDTGTTHKFTGKERDAESGLDNFGARYNSSTLGRFMTPDWAARPTAIPYAVFGDPQSLNLYLYVRDNPINNIDVDGHVDCVKNANGNGLCDPKDNQAEQQDKTPSFWTRVVNAFTFSKSKTKEANLVNQTDKDPKVGLVANTKIVGVSVSGSITSDPQNNKAQISGGVEAHGVQSELNFSSNADGSKGLVNGKITNNFLTGQASASLGTGGLGAKAEAQLVTWGGSLGIGPVTFSGSVCAVCIGAKASLTSSGASAGVEEGLVGADFSVRWSDETVFSKSAGQN